MRKSILILGVLFITTIGCSQKITDSRTNADSGTKTYDPKLVGCWKGSEVDQQEKGLSKYWVSCRFEDGTSTLLFIAIDKKGKVTQETENGNGGLKMGNIMNCIIMMV